MFTQILTTALVFGIFLIFFRVFRNRYLGKPWEFTILTLLSYVLVSIPCFIYTLIIGAGIFRDSDGHSCVAAISLFTPVLLEFFLTLLVREVLSSDRRGTFIKKTKAA